jgi:hypothetical protein
LWTLDQSSFQACPNLAEADQATDRVGDVGTVFTHRFAVNLSGSVLAEV